MSPTKPTEPAKPTNQNDAATEHPIQCVALQAKNHKMLLARREYLDT